MSEEIKEELEGVFIEDEDFLEELSKWDKKEAEKIEEENQKKIEEEKEIEIKKKVSNRIRGILAEAATVKEVKSKFDKNKKEILPKYPITFTPVNTYEKTKELIDNYFKIRKTEKTEELLKEYFDTETKEEKKIEEKKETIINNLHLNNLKCNFTVNDIEYTFTFTENKIYMVNNSTGEELETNYNLDICSLIFENINNNNSIIYKKNKNGVSIASLMLRNNINKGTEKGSLCYAFQQYINNHPETKIDKLFLTTVCEAGNIDIFKYIFLNYKGLFDKNMLDAACFSGNTEIIRVLIQEGYQVDFNTLKAAFSGNDTNLIEFLLDVHSAENLGLNNINKIYELFGVIKNPKIGLYFIDNFIHQLSKNIENDQRQFSSILNKMRKYDDKVANFKPKLINGKIISDDKIKLANYNLLKKYNETRKYEEMDKNKLIETYLYSMLFLRLIQANRLEMFCFFIKEIEENLIKIDINIEENFTPLHYAIYNGNIDIINVLLSFEDIELNLKNNLSPVAPLHIAAKNENPEIIKTLLSHEKVEVNSLDYDWCTPLHIAARNKNPEVIKALLSHKDIDVNTKNKHDFTPLHIAIRCNENPEVIKALLSHKDIDVNIKNTNDFTPLQIAVRYNKDPEVIKALLSHKDIDVNIIDSSRNTLLHIAASYVKNPEIVKVLIANKNIDINAENKDGFTPLKIATFWGNIGIIKILLSCDNIKIDHSLIRQLQKYPEIREELEIYKDKQKKLKNQNMNNTFIGAIGEINNIPVQQNKGTFNSMKGNRK